MAQVDDLLNQVHAGEILALILITTLLSSWWFGLSRIKLYAAMLVFGLALILAAVGQFLAGNTAVCVSQVVTLVSEPTDFHPHQQTNFDDDKLLINYTLEGKIT